MTDTQTPHGVTLRRPRRRKITEYWGARVPGHSLDHVDFVYPDTIYKYSTTTWRFLVLDNGEVWRTLLSASYTDGRVPRREKPLYWRLAADERDKLAGGAAPLGVLKQAIPSAMGLSRETAAALMTAEVKRGAVTLLTAAPHPSRAGR